MSLCFSVVDPCWLDGDVDRICILLRRGACVAEALCDGNRTFTTFGAVDDAVAASVLMRVSLKRTQARSAIVLDPVLLSLQ